jgi:aspartyl/asparaginyl beta-hydroxylase (cupin superfamily)
MNKIWFSTSGKPYNGNEPYFLSPENYEWAVKIEQNWNEIKKEIMQFIYEKDNDFTANSFFFGGKLGDSWSSIYFLNWRYNINMNNLNKHCPKLYNLLERIPGLISLSFSRLSPDTIIPIHYGDTNAVMRCHLGIEVADGLPLCGIKVGNEARGWEEGKWLLFNDSYIHTAWNKTNKNRIVLMMDVIKPEFLNKKRFLYAYGVSRIYVYSFKLKNNLLEIRSTLFDDILFTFIYPIIYVKNLLPFLNKQIWKYQS